MYPSDVEIIPAIGKGRNVFSRMRIALATYVVCKHSVYLALQIAFVNLHSKWSDLSLTTNCTNFDKQQTGEQFQKLESLMQRYGVVIRESGPAAMLIFSYQVTMNLVFALSDIITRGRISACYKRDSFFFSYLDESMSDEQLRRTFDRYLRKMISLNADKRKTIVINSHLSEFSSDESKLLVADLNQQQSQLRKLLTDKSSIWPANRAESWKKDQISFAPRFYGSIVSVYYAFSILFLLIYHHHCVAILKIRTRSQLTLLERLSLAEYYMMIYVLIEPGLAPMILLAISIRDKRMYLKTIRKRFANLNAMLVELKRLQRQRFVNFNTNDDIFYLRKVCDQEALAIYLNLRVFIDEELRSATGVANLIVNQYCFLLPSLLLPFLAIQYHSIRSQLVLLVLLVCVHAVATNAVIGACANLESHCIKTTQRAWTLVANLANAEEPNTCYHCKDSPEASDLLILRRLLLAKSANWRFFRGPLGGDRFVFDQARASLINAHTASLWRRFVLDMPTLHEHFHSSALGSIRLNYSEMMRINFWFISVVLSILTNGK